MERDEVWLPDFSMTLLNWAHFPSFNVHFIKYLMDSGHCNPSLMALGGFLKKKSQDECIITLENKDVHL